VIDLKPEAMPAALENGDVDVVSIWMPPILDVQNKLGERGITFYNEEIYTQTMNIVAKQEFIRTSPEKVKRLLRALVRAEEFSRDNSAAAQRIVAEFNRMDAEKIRDMWGDSSFTVTLDQALIIALEDESRWAIKGGLTGARVAPNFLDCIYFDGLKAVKPDAVRILR